MVRTLRAARRGLGAALAALSWLAPAPAVAQVPADPSAEEAAPADPVPEPAAKGLRLPTPVRITPAVYPPEALAAGRSAEVLLELQLSDSGEVVCVTVLEPAGDGFDASVAAAAQSWRFTPAVDEKGDAVGAVIQYRYRFQVEAAPTVSLEVTLKTAGTRERLADATVVLRGPDGTQRTARTDAEGHLQAVELTAGIWLVLASAPGYDADQAEIAVQDGKVAQLTMYLELDRPWEAARSDAELVVEGDRITPEITERDLDAADIRYLPGSGGDLVRAVQNMPGVARTSFNAGQVQVRGTQSENTGFFLGGAPLPIVFHFGGLSTVVNSDSLDEVAFLPGGYGVRYGRRLAGAVDLRTNKRMPERSRGYVSMDLFQSTVFVEEKVSDHVAVTVSGRRSYIDAILQPIINAQTSSELRLPRYWDLQTRVLWERDDGSNLDVMILTSDDRFTLSEPDADAPGGTRDSLLVSRFTKLWAQYRWEHGDGWLSEHTFSVGPERIEVVFRESEEAWENPFRYAWRSELYRAVPEGGHIGWRMGVDAQAVREKFRFNLAGFGDLLSFRGDEEGQGMAWMPAIYLEQTQRDGIVQATPGVRVDWVRTLDADGNTVYQATTVDPRMRGKVDVTDTTALLLAGGKYSQFPAAREYLSGDEGADALLPQYAMQADLGAKHSFSDALSGELHVYHWWLVDLVSGHEDRFEFQLGPPPVPPLDTGDYASEGSGRVFGSELLVRYETDRTFGWLSATVSRSTRIDRPEEPELVFDQDQPVVLNALASRQLAGRWRVGARWRYASGKPYVPVANRVLDLNSHAFFPVWDEAARSRLPAYWAFDVRVDKDFVFRKWMLTAYLDLMNATNRRNLEMVTPSADYSQEIPVYGLPIIPAFGLRGEW